MRFAVAAAVLLAVSRPRLHGRSRRFWLGVAQFGAVLAALNFSLYEAIARVPMGTAVTLQFLGPPALALLGLHRRLDLIWLLAASAGVVLLTGGPAGGSDAGITFALLAAVIAAASVLMARRLASERARASTDSRCRRRRGRPDSPRRYSGRSFSCRWQCERSVEREPDPLVRGGGPPRR